MRGLLSVLCTVGLLAAEPLRIVAVERPGLPPYEDDQRVYRLTAASGVRPGDLLELARPGSRVRPGRLRVLQATSQGVLATMALRGDTYPLKGDQALHLERTNLPGLPPTQAVAAPPPLAATVTAVPREPRFLLEPLYFLPGDATVSPLGRTKAEAWVRDFGDGWWTLEIPSTHGRASRLDAARAKALEAVLKAAGLKAVQVRTVVPAPGQRGNAVLVRFQETAPAKAVRSRKA
jgi:hypothetical protein